MQEKNFTSHDRSCGFTLIELLLTLLVLVILFMIAIPALQHLVIQNRTTAEINKLVSAINFARSAAIKTGMTVTFCKSKNLKTCSGNWRDGQIVLIGNKVLRSYPALGANNQLTWSSSLGKDDVLEFLPTGFTNGQNGSFNYCPHDQRYAKRIVINQAGRVRVTTSDINCLE